MIDVHYAATPNGLKVRLFLEESGIAHRLLRVDLGAGEQFRPDFLAIAPNNKIPAIVDHAPADRGEPHAVFESGAILWYLAGKTGRFVPREPRARSEALQWLFWQMAGLGPMAGQAGYFRVYAPDAIPFAIERYTRETRRLYGVLDARLAQHEYVVGEYSIVDMACYPWIVPHAGHGQSLGDFPHLSRWFAAVAARPATIRAYAGVVDVYAARSRPIPDRK